MLLVVRGLPNKVDPTYRCVTEKNDVNSYGIVELSNNGNVTRKMSLPYEARSDVEKLMKSYRSVFVDKRKGQIPLSYGEETQDASNILSIIRRQKSETEKQELLDLANSALKQTSGEQIFRSSAHKSKNKCFFKEEDKGSFIQYRSGLQSENGLCSDVAMCTAKTKDASNYLTRLYRAIETVKPYVRPGASFENLEYMLQRNTPYGVDVVGTSFNHIGYERVDPIQSNGVIEPHDAINMNVTFRGRNGIEATIHGGLYVFDEDYTNHENSYRAAVATPGSTEGADSTADAVDAVDAADGESVEDEESEVSPPSKKAALVDKFMDALECTKEIDPEYNESDEEEEEEEEEEEDAAETLAELQALAPDII